MKKELHITLYMSELIYDVKNKTSLTGHSRYNGSNPEETANMQVNDDEDNVNQIARSIGSAFSVLKTKLSEYLSEDGTTSDNEQISSEDNLTLTLLLPSNFNFSAKDTVTSCLHTYIVNSAIGEWFVITNKADADTYIATANASIDMLREALNKRVRPVRKTPTKQS